MKVKIEVKKTDNYFYRHYRHDGTYTYINKKDCEIIKENNMVMKNYGEQFEQFEIEKNNMEPFLTDEQVNKLYLDLCDLLYDCPLNEFKSQLKLTNWIEKTKLEEFKEYYQSLFDVEDIHIEHCRTLYSKANAVIQELQEKIKEYENNKN